MPLVFDPPEDVRELLALIPPAEAFVAARIRRALRFLIEAVSDWLALEETTPASGDPAFNMSKDELGLSEAELEWFIERLPEGYRAQYEGDGLTLLIYTP